MNEFIKLNVSNKIIDILDKENITIPSPIQKKAIPLLLDGKDVIGMAKTGTGKTFAYSIPLIENIDLNNRFIKALILWPTRELSIQVKKEVEKLLSNFKLSICAIYGGESYEIQNRRLKNKPDIIVGTPGRIIDQMEKGNIDFSNVKYLVLDEADEMLKMGFEEDLEKILSNVPKKRQTALFSATLPSFVVKVGKNYMNSPVEVRIENDKMTVDSIDQIVYFCKKESKKDLVIRLLDYYQFNHIMIFCNTKAMVDELLVFLQNNDFKVDGLHGDLKQALRDRVMGQFRNGVTQILICTDVAARGIDIDDIDCVINYDIPNENELYVHRIGRTARAGRSGTSITLSTIRGKNRINELEKYTNSIIRIEEVPTIEKLNEMYQKKLYLTIKDSIDKNKDNYDFDKLITKFSKENQNPIPLIRALMALEFNKNIRTYPEIIPINDKKKRDNKKDNKDNKNKKNDKKNSKPKQKSDNYAVIEVNLGESDKVKPNLLINTLNSEYKIHREHFGKVEINKTRTYFEIKKDALRFFDTNKRIRIKDKTMVFRLVDKKLK